jgi:hypothetical protein
MYSGISRRLELGGPTEFFGDGHHLRAAGGAVADDRFEAINLRGPVTGVARPWR